MVRNHNQWFYANDFLLVIWDWPDGEENITRYITVFLTPMSHTTRQIKWKQRNRLKPLKHVHLFQLCSALFVIPNGAACFLSTTEGISHAQSKNNAIIHVDTLSVLHDPFITVHFSHSLNVQCSGSGWHLIAPSTQGEMNAYWLKNDLKQKRCVKRKFPNAKTTVIVALILVNCLQPT